MTPGLGYALGAMVCFGLGDLVYKRGAAAGAKPHQFLMVQTWVFAPSVLAYGLATGTLHLTSAAWWGSLAGCFALFGFYNFAYSLKSGSVSINAPVFRLNFTITAALAILVLGEAFTVYKMAGIALAFAAVWLLLASPTPESAAGAHERRSSLLRVLAATVAVGVANFLYKVGVQAGATPASLVVAQAGFVVMLSTAFSAGVDRGIRASRAALRYAPVAAVVLAAAFCFLLESLAHGEASVVVPIGQMGFVVTVLLGVFFLREPFTVRKAAGLAAALAALASLAYG